MAQTPRRGTSSATSAVGEGGIDLQRYFRLIVKRKGVIAVTGVIVFAACILWTLRQPKVYRATATVLVESSAPQVLGKGVNEVVDLGSGSYWWNQEYFNTLMNIATSRVVISKALENTPVLGRPEFWDLGVDGSEPPSPEVLSTLERFSGVDQVAASISVDEARDSKLILLSSEDVDAERAVTVANAVAQALVDWNLERKLETTRGASDWLGDQMSELRLKLEQSERSLQQFKEENDILTTSIEDRQKISSERLVMLNNELTRVRLKKVEQEARLRQAKGLREKSDHDELGGSMARDILKSQVITELKRRSVELKSKLAEHRERYDEKHPTMIGTLRQMETVKSDLDREIARMLDAEESAYQETLDVEKRLEEMLATERGVAGEFNRKELTYNQLKREVENSSRLFELVNRRLKETDLTGVLRTNNLSLLEEAQRPQAPVYPSVKKNVLLGFFLALVLALMVAFGLEQIDNTIKSHEDVEITLGVPFLGIVPAIRDAGRAEGRIRTDLITLDAPKSSAAESCRALRTNLLFMSPDRPLAGFVVTSAGPQEGKTTVTNALAITMAQAGSRVIVVDTDMRRPRMHRVYGVSNEIGISNVIVGEASLSDAIKHSEVPLLDVLPCGPLPPNPAELLLSNAFKVLLEKLKERYDRVIFDSPPIGAVTDPVILASMTDGAILVFKGGRSTIEIGKRAIRALTDANARILGAVVNDLDVESRKYGYYYYSYNKKYGHYYGELEAEERTRPAKA